MAVQVSPDVIDRSHDAEQAEANSGSAVEERHGRARALPPNPRRVLIVEDNRDGRDTLQSLLQILGYVVEVAEDGITGLQKARTWQPHIAVVDIGLPGLDGYQLAQRIRAECGDGVFLIAHTGYGLPDDRRRALESGFNAHMVKPLDLDAMLVMIAQLPPPNGV